MGKSRPLDFEVVKKRARELRGKATYSETLLWKELRNRKLCGYKFLRQHPMAYNPYGSGVKYFVADFYCDIKKTLIELDGPIHESNIEYDILNSPISYFTCSEVYLVLGRKSL